MGRIENGSLTGGGLMALMRSCANKFRNAPSGGQIAYKGIQIFASRWQGTAAGFNFFR